MILIELVSNVVINVSKVLGPLRYYENYTALILAAHQNFNEIGIATFKK